MDVFTGSLSADLTLLQVIGLQRPLGSLASLIDRGFGKHTKLELVFVMLVCPLGMNMLQVRTSRFLAVRSRVYHLIACSLSRQRALSEPHPFVPAGALPG